MTTPAPPPAQPSTSRWLALGILCTGNLMIILDGSIVTIALPTIQQDLGFTQSGLAWVVNSYLIAFAGLLLLSGRLGDLLGSKQVFIVGLVVFTAASLACGVASTPWALVTFRFVQGVGGALASAVALGMIITLFQNAAERAKALAVYAFVAAAGSSLGLILGGVLTQSLGWEWVFLVNVPIGAAAIVLTLRSVPGLPGIGLREGADVAGSLLVTGGLMLLVFTITKAEDYTWGDARTLGLLARPVLLGGLLLVAVALALLARVPSNGRYLVDIVPAFVLLGLGFGAAMPALMGQAMAVTSPTDAGVASGLVNTTQQVGASLGTAVLATVAASRTASLLADRHSQADALTSGFRLAYTLSAAFVVVSLLVAAFVLRTPRTAKPADAEPAPSDASAARS
ncbi:MFS transporter [Micromonospora matsumotoense]|uniref:MFS transporter n=1 Tax=Micromonospora matsumotoense TaxID=121616 RepID=UPI003428DC01